MLRLAQPGDSRQLAAIAREAYGKYADLLDEPPAPILLDYADVAVSGRTYVATEADQVLGMVTIEDDAPNLILRNLAVRPSSQGRGIGRLLALLVEDIARANGMRGIRLWTRAEMRDNIAFYTKLNYVITHSEQTARSHRVFFYKQLTSELPDDAATAGVALTTNGSASDRHTHTGRGPAGRHLRRRGEGAVHY